MAMTQIHVRENKSWDMSLYVSMTQSDDSRLTGGSLRTTTSNTDLCSVWLLDT